MLRTSYTKLSDKLWTPYTYFSDNRHEDFEVNVKNEGENEVFHSFYHAHRDREVFLHHICRDKFSLANPFNAIPQGGRNQNLINVLGKTDSRPL